MNKYDPLCDYLKRLPKSIFEKTMLFLEVEQILGAVLPPSASDHRQWWENPSSSKQYPHAQSWLAAGWKVDDVNLRDKWVRFKRN